MVSFTVLHDFGVLRNICDFCRDNERVFFSHTCVEVRGAVVQWIPSLSSFKTLTRPKVLPELFEEKNGVYSVAFPKNNIEFYFQLFMLGHSDIDRKGVKALKWFKAVTGKTPQMDTKRALIMKFLLSGDEEKSLSDRQMLVLKKRLEAGRDELMLVHDTRHWDIVRDMLMTNTSIDRFILFSPRNSMKVNCYESIFLSLSERAVETKYLDLQGILSTRTLIAFPRVAFHLTSLMMRRLTSGVISVLLATILSRPNDANLHGLYFDSVSLDEEAENHMLDILDTLPIKKLLLSDTTLTARGFTRVVSVLGNSDMDKVHFRQCKLGICEIVQCLFLPTVSGSSLQELVLERIHIPDSAAGALASCVESSHFLNTLSLEGCRLGARCVEMVVEGLKKSSLSSLNLGDNYLGEETHNLFINIGKRGTMRNLILDFATICSHSVKEFRWARSLYKNNDTELHVSVRKCKLNLGFMCTAKLI